MLEVGERLRCAREEKGLTLTEIQNSTKIRAYYLKALEEGNIQLIPGQVYVRGFLQNYAVAVGLDPHELIDLYDRLRAVDIAPPPLPEAPEETKTAAPIHLHLRWWHPILVGGVVLLVACVILIGREGTGVKRGPAMAERSPSSADSTAPAQANAGRVRLVLRFRARCWVSLRRDGREVFSETVDAGTVQEWSADEIIEARFGNAGGVRAEINGKDLGLLGATGENVAREFRRP